MAKPEIQPFGITKAIDKSAPLEANPGNPVGPVPPPVIPTNEIFTDGTGGLVVDHLFGTTDTISLLGVSPIHDHLV